MKSAVKVWAEALEHDLHRGDWADPHDGQMTLDQWWAKWSDTRTIERATSDRDGSHYRCHVGPQFGLTRLSEITSWDVESWLAGMQRKHVGKSAAAQSFRLLHHMMSDAKRHRMIQSDPTVDIRQPKVPKHVDRFLTEAEFWRLDEVMPTDRDRAMLRCMAFAGLRWGEVAGLHSDRVDLDAARLLVVEVQRRDLSIKAQPKSTAGQRYVPLPAELVEMLRPFVHRGHVPVFPHVGYTNWRSRVFVPAVLAAELAEPYPTIHDMRHTYGSWLAGHGVSPTDIGALMGHSSLRATERYLHAYPARFERALDALARRPLIEP